MSYMRFAVALPLLFLSLGAPQSAQADASFAGHVVIARDTEDALLIWDATSELTQMAGAHVGDAAAKVALERAALSALSATLPQVANSKTITLRVVYSETGELSAAYGIPTFAGIQRYAILSMDARSAALDRDKWKELNEHAPIPAWVNYKVTGKLPSSS